MPAILGGHVDMSSSTLTTSAPLIKAGQLRCLGITSKTRHPDFPNIPTTEELGYPYVNLRVWDGIFTPTGVPQSVLNVLYPVVEKIFRDPDLVDRVTKAGFTVEYKGPEEFRKFIETEYNGIVKIVKDINLKKQ